jgi:osmoprotectant transport system substrate-binding protein
VAEQPSVTIRADTYDMASGLDELFAPVAAALDIDTLRTLVGRITQDDEDPRMVARDWLVEEGLAEP